MQTTMKKVKEGTKGQKQIIMENQETLTFYKAMAFCALLTYVGGMFIFSTFATIDLCLVFFSLFSYATSYQFMVYISTPKYSESGQLIDSGIDLNMMGGIAEHVKDLIIITAGCQVLSLCSYYFWFLWLFVPVRGAWILWTTILSPYIFNEDADNKEVEEKKQRKLERRMRRHQGR